MLYHICLIAGILCDSLRYEKIRLKWAHELADKNYNHKYIPVKYWRHPDIITPHFNFEVVLDRVTKLNSICITIEKIIQRGINDDKHKPKLPSNNYLYMDYTIYLPEENLSKFQKDLHSYIKIAEVLLQFEFKHVTYFWNKEDFAIFFDWTLNLLRNSDDDWKDKINKEPIAKELILTAKFPIFFIKLRSKDLTFIIDNLKNNPPIQDQESNFTVDQLEIWFNNLTRRKKIKK